MANTWGAPANTLGAAQSRFLDALGARRVVITADGAAPGSWADLDHKFLPYMAQHGITAMLVRPDFYLYGAVAQADDTNALVDDLAADLRHHGVHSL